MPRSHASRVLHRRVHPFAFHPGFPLRYPGSPSLGKFYVVTDGDTHTYPEGWGYFWDEVDKSVVKVFGQEQSLWGKMLLPYSFLIVLAYICNFVGYLFSMKLKLNPFNVNVLIMHRWFVTTAAETELKVRVLVGCGHYLLRSSFSVLLRGSGVGHRYASELQYAAQWTSKVWLRGTTLTLCPPLLTV